jgi:NTP pyrophosphatase (non-canonical NTP hydrolase)
MYEQGFIFREKHWLQSSPGNIFGNITKETMELHDEVEAENELRTIDELCDHVIYPINILEALGHDAQSNIDAIQERDSELLEKAGNPKVAVSCFMVALANYSAEKDIKALALIARIALKTLDAMGYHAELCVIEKFKTVNSREGAYDSQQEKWCKNPDQDPATLYKPQYENCKK